MRAGEAKNGEIGADYREQLRAELSRRRLTRSAYSLRAFARALEVSPAFLSKVLSGQKDLSLDKAVGVATRLGYNAEETSQFCKQVQLSKAKSDRLRSALAPGPLEEKSVARDFVPLPLDAFQAISDWQHYAILELTYCRGFKMSGDYVRRRLGISIEEARSALNRLVRLGLLKQDRGRWVKSDAFIATPTDQPNRALRNFHLQMIEKAKVAVETQPPAKRDITGVTLPISAEKVELAKAEIKAFRRRMARILESSRPTEVYQLNVQFFSLTPREGEDL